MAEDLILCEKGRALIGLYTEMVDKGHERGEGEDAVFIAPENVFSSFQLRSYAASMRPFFEQFGIATTLDYGSGGSDWLAPGFDPATGQSALEYFKLEHIYCYEPARNMDQRQLVDCVISFDVLEHIFVADVRAVLHDLFRYAGKLLIVNVACYPAAAKLPNGENAHVTVRAPQWWKGIVDSVALDYPEVSVLLICSTSFQKSNAFPIWKAADWHESSTFVVAN